MIGILAIAFCPLALMAQSTINVPADVPTIQAAINAASNGDTVLVAPGTYTENINFSGKAITLKSSGGPSVTTIDGSAKGTVVTFNSGETTNSQLSGFTIRNGFQNGLSGGGIAIYSASPTIVGNVITGNHAAVGIGIYINGGAPVIQNNLITANDQTGAGDGGQGGGGIAVSGSNTTPAAPLITGNTITNNSVAGGGEGGGISVTYFSSPTIENNLIQGNTAYNSGGGIAIDSYNASTVVQNIIVNNTSKAGGSGAGLYIDSRNNPGEVYANNTIAGNSAFDNTSGIFITGTPQQATVTNNLIIAASGQNAVTCNATYSSISAIFSYNDAFSPTGQPWVGICDSTSHPGNISVDPQFVNAAGGDYHLQASSPVIDVGINSQPNALQTDYDGNSRILDGNNDCIATIDLGAYEVVPTIAASISPLSLAFGSQIIGTTSNPQQVTVTSSGQTCFQFASVQITGDFAQTNTCPSSGVPGGTACTFSISFTPTATGPRSGNLVINSANSTSFNVPLSGTGVTPAAVSLSPGSLSFGLQLVGTTSGAQTVTLTNTGGASLNITSYAISGPFSQSNNCPSALAAGSSCTISVSFSPVARGAASGGLNIADNASGSPQSISLSGTGGVILASVSPTSLSFSNQALNSVSAAQQVTLTNVGDFAINLSSIAATGDFSQTNNCGTSIAPAASCAVSVVFSPTVAGTRAGTLTFSDNASGSPQTVSLTGTGVDFSISVSPSSASVHRGSSVNFTVTLSPLGGAFNNTVALSCSGLPADSTCVFTPASAVPGSSGANSVMTINTNSRGTPTGTFTVTISGQSGSLLHSAQLTLTVRKH